MFGDFLSGSHGASTATKAAGSVMTSMLWAPPADISQGVNYDPMNPLGNQTDDRKEAKIASRVTSLVTKIRNGALFSGPNF